MTTVEKFHWNPMRPRFRGRIGKRLPFRRPLNNFGDLLGPLIINEIVERETLKERTDSDPVRLLSVGSILHFASEGDVVWGSGVNGKESINRFTIRDLDVRSVRGPLTREYLLGAGVYAPESYGDPGLLVSHLWPNLALEKDASEATVVMNFNDMSSVPNRFSSINPRSPVFDCLRRIASSNLVIGSSLHAIIVAESYGVPARLVRSMHEPSFKYDDYYAGTGRGSYSVAENLDEALEMGGEFPPVWSAASLLETFPRDLWQRED